MDNLDKDIDKEGLKQLVKKTINQYQERFPLAFKIWIMDGLTVNDISIVLKMSSEEVHDLCCFGINSVKDIIGSRFSSPLIEKLSAENHK